MLSVILTHNLKLGKQSIPWNTYWIWEDRPDIHWIGDNSSVRACDFTQFQIKDVDQLVH